MIMTKSLKTSFLHHITDSSHLNSFADTSVSEIEEGFKTFTQRSDIAILLINQNVSVFSYLNIFMCPRSGGFRVYFWLRNYV